MSDETSTIRARFALRFRCGNCRLVMCRELVSPAIADAPGDVEELLGSAFLALQIYPCEACDNPVSSLIGIRQIGPDETLDTSGEGTARCERVSPGAMTSLQRATALATARRRGLR